MNQNENRTHCGWVIGLAYVVFACGLAGCSAAGISGPAAANPQADADLQHIAFNRLPARVEKARLLRSKWRGWANAHRPQILALRKAQPGDIAILRHAFDLLPAFPDGRRTAITFEDLNGGGSIFSWRQGSVTPLAKADFARFRDIELCRSVSIGRYTVILWASGRITQSAIEEQPIVNGRYAFPGRPVFIEGNPVEIEPAFEFLKGL